MEEAQAARGAQFVQTAEAALKRWSLFGGSQKYEDAAEAYQKAGNCFKTAKRWQDAGDNYKQAAANHRRADNASESVKCITNAGDVLKNINIEESVQCYRECVAHYSEMGRLVQAAKLLKEIAKMYEDDQNWQEALENYDQAASFFSGENSHQLAGQCQLRVAEIAASECDPPEFARAASVFEEQGDGCLDNNLLKFNAKRHYMNALLCYLAQDDVVMVERKIGEYQNKDYTFGGSRECEFCQNLHQAATAGDEGAFTEHLNQYNTISPLDPFKIKLLLTVKRRLTAATSIGDLGAAINDVSLDGGGDAAASGGGAAVGGVPDLT